MLWFKRNLFFVLSMLAGLGLICWAAYGYYSVTDKNRSVADELKDGREKLKGLKTKSPLPSDENIAAAQEDKKRVAEFLAQFRTAFSPFPTPPKLDNRGFRNHLEETLGQLGLEATNADVALPQNFKFAFSTQMEKLSYEAENIDPWLRQLEEIKVICEILFRARISALDSIQRVRVSDDDTAASDYIVGAETMTNQSGLWTTTPYKITFRGYSEQIAAVLEGFARSPHCWIIKDVDVKQSMQTVPVVMPVEEVPQAPMPMRPNPYGSPYGNPYNDPRRDPRAQFGQGGRPYGGGAPGMGERPYRPYLPPPTGYVPPPAPTVPVTILSPKILFVNLAVDLIKIKPPEVETNKPAASPNSRGRGALVPGALVPATPPAAPQSQ